MKRMITLSCILLSLIISLNAESRIDLGMGLGYTNNLYELSDSDMDNFENSSGFDYVETSDDFIQKLSLGYFYTYRSKDFRFSPSAKINSSFCLNNPDKNNVFLAGGFNSRYEKIQVDARYTFYPKNYVRMYKDSDGTGDLEKYTYEKNMYKISGEYIINKKISPGLYLKYENYYFNKYFTESDANAVTFGFGNTWNNAWGDLKTYYYFRHYINESDNEMMQEIIENDKNSSYDSNIFEVKFTAKKRYSTWFDYKPFICFTYRTDYYQTDLDVSTDPVHSGRIDHKYTINPGIEIFLLKNLNFRLDLVQDIRRVKSDNVNLNDTKDFNKTQILGNFTWSFDFN